MASGISTRLTAAEGRKFAFTVGAAFLVLSGVLWWRDHLLARNILAAVSGTLLLAGLLVPSHLGPVHGAWMGLAHAISKVTTPIFMGIVYFLVLFPIGALRRAMGRNSLQHVKHENGYWYSRDRGPERHSDMKRQF